MTDLRLVAVPAAPAETADPGARAETKAARLTPRRVVFRPERHPRDRHGQFTHHGGPRLAVRPVARRPGSPLPATAPSPAALRTRGRPGGAGTVEDPIDVAGDIPRAAALLAEGKHIRLNQPDQVATLLDELARLVADARAQGERAPTYDLCRVSIPGTNLFCGQHQGLARARMPQLRGRPTPGTAAARVAAERGVSAAGNVDMTPEFRAALAAAGVRVIAGVLPASHLRASQMELDGAKVAAMAQAMEAGLITDAPIFITRDGYILDGHHGWAAKVGVDARDNRLGDVHMPVEVIDLDIGAALDFANAFTAAHGLAPKPLVQPVP